MIDFSKQEKFILDNQDYFWGFAIPIIFPPYAAWSFSSDFVALMDPSIKGSSSKQKAGAATSMALTFAYDVWSVNRGLSTTGAARTTGAILIKDFAKSKIKLGTNIPTNTGAIKAFTRGGAIGAGAAVAVSAWANLTYPNVTITHGPYGSVHIMPGLGYMGGQF